MWMEAHIYSVKVKSQASNIWAKDKMTTQRPKPQDTQLGILKIYAFSLKIQQRALCPGESAAGVAYWSVRIHPKSCHMFHLKVATTYWIKEQRSWSIAVT